LDVSVPAQTIPATNKKSVKAFEADGQPLGQANHATPRPTPDTDDATGRAPQTNPTKREVMKQRLVKVKD
jgi:hypothetical protein